MHWAYVPPPVLQGLWWLPAAGEALSAAPAAGGAATAAAAGDAELLRLAAAARMNTDVRRAAFCCVMGAEDATDAFERLLRLGLKACLLHGPLPDFPYSSSAAFCCVLGAEDATDAFERLFRLGLKLQQRMPFPADFFDWLPFPFLGDGRAVCNGCV